MPSKTIVLPLECSGNKRKDFEPPTFGTQWDDGAISQGRWTGVPLSHLLNIIGVKDSAYDVVFEGPYQELDYHYFPYEDSDEAKAPVTLMKVNSIIQKPLPQSTLAVGIHEIYGIGWTGEGIINKVEISFDNGQNWKEGYNCGEL